MTRSGSGRRYTPWYPMLAGFAVGALFAGLLAPLVGGNSVSVGSAPVDAAPVDSGAHAVVPAGTGVTVATEGDRRGIDPGAKPPTGSSPVGGAAHVPGAVAPARGASTHAAGEHPAPQPATRLGSTDRGVTSSKIKVAFFLLDLGQAGRLGVNTTGVDPKQQRAAFEALVADLNARGGIHGRMIDPYFRVFDTTSPDDQRAACIAATEDEKAFAVVAMPGYINAAVLCITQEHHTPLVMTGQGISREFLRKSEGRLVTLQMAGDRMMLNFADLLHQKGVLKGRTIGVVSSEEPQYVETVEGVFVPGLRRLGYKVARVSRLATFPRWESQLAIEVQQMRAAGVDTVVFVSAFLAATSWVQTAEQQRWFPAYLASEWAGMTSDFEIQAMPQSFTGALAMTSQRFGEWRAGVPAPATAQRCIELYEKKTGERVPRNNGDDSNTAYPVLLYSCDVFRVFEATAATTGPELTRAAWVAAIQRTEPIEGAFYFPGSFGPGKPDLTDHVRLIRADISCRCWRIADAVRPASVR